MKKMLTILLCGSIILGLTGCEGTKDFEETKKNEFQEEVESLKNELNDLKEEYEELKNLIEDLKDHEFYENYVKEELSNVEN